MAQPWIPQGRVCCSTQESWGLSACQWASALRRRKGKGSGSWTGAEHAEGCWDHRVPVGGTPFPRPGADAGAVRLLPAPLATTPRIRPGCSALLKQEVTGSQ